MCLEQNSVLLNLVVNDESTRVSGYKFTYPVKYIKKCVIKLQKYMLKDTDGFKFVN